MLTYNSGPGESSAVGSSEPHVDCVSEGIYDLDRSDEFFVASELLEALEQLALW